MKEADSQSNLYSSAEGGTGVSFGSRFGELLGAPLDALDRFFAVRLFAGALLLESVGIWEA
jgi:hypothetical protein